MNHNHFFKIKYRGKYYLDSRLIERNDTPVQFQPGMYISVETAAI